MLESLLVNLMVFLYSDLLRIDILGMGLGMIYLPAVVVITTYFDKKLSLASGVASCGSGVGTFTFAPIMHLLDDNYGFEFTLLVLGLIILFCFPLGTLCQPHGASQSNPSVVHDDGEEFRMVINISNSSKVGAAMKYCKGIIFSATQRGKNYLSLLLDAKCGLYMLSNFLTCMGAAVPFVYTAVGTSKKTCKHFKSSYD